MIAKQKELLHGMNERGLHGKPRVAVLAQLAAVKIWGNG